MRPVVDLASLDTFGIVVYEFDSRIDNDCFDSNTNEQIRYDLNSYRC